MLLVSATQPLLLIDLGEKSLELSQSGLDWRDCVMAKHFETVRFASCL